MNLQQRNILLQARDYILAHPGKLWMEHYYWEAAYCRTFIPEHLDCGTVYCIAGLICHLNGKNITNADVSAASLIGLSKWESRFLFFFHSIIFSTGGPYYNECLAIQDMEPGTKEYIEIVIRVIDKCIERNFISIETIVEDLKVIDECLVERN